MKSKEDILAILQEAKPTLSREFGITDIGLFGSYAKGTHTEQSDVDLLYEVGENLFFGLRETEAFETYMRAILGTDNIDFVHAKYLNPIIGLEIKNHLIHV